MPESIPAAHPHTKIFIVNGFPVWPPTPAACRGSSEQCDSDGAAGCQPFISHKEAFLAPSALFAMQIESMSCLTDTIMCPVIAGLMVCIVRIATCVSLCLQCGTQTVYTPTLLLRFEYILFGARIWESNEIMACSWPARFITHFCCSVHFPSLPINFWL